VAKIAMQRIDSAGWWDCVLRMSRIMLPVFRDRKKKHFIYIARRSLRIENKFPFRKCSMSFTVHMLQYCWINNNILLHNFTVRSFLWEYCDHSTAVFQKWSVALSVRIFWAVNTYCTPNCGRCSMQWRIS
jgi:hypothetical protein